MGDVLKTVDDATYNESYSCGKVYDSIGQVNTSRIILREKDKELLNKYLSEYDFEDTEAHMDYKYLMTGRESRLTDMREINNNIMKLYTLATTLDDSEEPSTWRHTFTNYSIKASCIENGKVLMIFTDNHYLGSLMKAQNRHKRVVCISVSQGTIYEITKADFQVYRYKYMVNALYSLTVHKQLIQKKGKISLAKADRSCPFYYVDTEFSSRAFDKCHTIWDIALVNGIDFYASIVSLIDCGRAQFKPMKDPGYTYDDIKGSPKIDEIRNKFYVLNKDKNPVIHYYHAPHDISMFYESHSYYEKGKSDDGIIIPSFDWKYKREYQKGYLLKLEEEKQKRSKHLEALTGNKLEQATQEYNKWLKEIEKEEEYDFEFVDCFKKTTLSELYREKTNTTSEDLRHIILHQAVSDALLLAEIEFLDKFSI